MSGLQLFCPLDAVPPSGPHSIFLAGPTPRTPAVPSWRPEAIQELRRIDYRGIVLAPEPFAPSVLQQLEWEKAGLENCSAIVFWVPRDLVTLPGFTTNVEFGRYVGSGRALYGRPDGAPHTGYLDWMYQDVCGMEPYDSLRSLMRAASGFDPERTT